LKPRLKSLRLARHTGRVGLRRRGRHAWRGVREGGRPTAGPTGAISIGCDQNQL